MDHNKPPLSVFVVLDNCALDITSPGQTVPYRRHYPLIQGMTGTKSVGGSDTTVIPGRTTPQKLSIKVGEPRAINTPHQHFVVPMWDFAMDHDNYPRCHFAPAEVFPSSCQTFFPDHQFMWFCNCDLSFFMLSSIDRSCLCNCHLVRPGLCFDTNCDILALYANWHQGIGQKWNFIDCEFDTM